MSDYDMIPTNEPFVEDSTLSEATSVPIPSSPFLLADLKLCPDTRGNIGGATKRQIPAALVSVSPKNRGATPPTICQERENDLLRPKDQYDTDTVQGNVKEDQSARRRAGNRAESLSSEDHLQGSPL